MVNKGLEIIEAHYLFNCDYDRIQVVVHPESIVHSMVQFVDGAIKAQLGLPDMRLPIQLALTYPARVGTGFEALDAWEMGTLHFEKPRFDVFPGINMAYTCGKRGGSAPIVMNAANEVVVAAFLEERSASSISCRSLKNVSPKRRGRRWSPWRRSTPSTQRRGRWPRS